MTMLLKPPIPERKYVGTIVKVIVSMEISVNIHMTNWICFLSIETKMNDRCHYLFSMQSLTRIALITGAASGFGTATARLLASHGIKVACCDRSFIHKSPSSDLVDSIQGEGNTLFCGMDTLNPNDVWLV